MNLFYKGSLCIANGMIVNQKPFADACVKLGNGRILGHIYDFERQNIRVQIHPDFLYFKDMTFVIRFPVSFISDLKEEDDRMLIIVPDQPFITTIENYYKEFEKSKFSKPSWLCVNFSEDPIARNYLNAFYQEKEKYLERLKKGERTFHGFILDQ